MKNEQRIAKTPKLRIHKATGQAYVVLNGRAIYFGNPRTCDPQVQYHKVIAEWLANGRQPQAPPNEITINELVARFWVHAKAYRIADNKTADLAEWDYEILPVELSELIDAGFDMDLLAFDEKELNKLLDTDIQPYPG